MKILYFIGTLRSGGKERRLIELMAGLKNNSDFEILLVLAFDQIDYEYFYNLGIEYISIDKTPNCKSLRPFFRLNSIVKKFKPDIIHSWGNMQSFYMAPIAFLNKIPLINSQITDAPPMIKKFSFQNFVNKFNFALSNIILANSYAGLKAYGVFNNPKSKVIHNGFDMNRIANLEIPQSVKEKIGINTQYIVGMVASFSDKKDYATYIKAACLILEKRKDITFICVGAGDDTPYKKMVPNDVKVFIKFLGRQENVESIMNICDIGVLSTYTEGISNSIMEFMALGKPVIATDGGGTKELLNDNETGYLVSQQTPKEIYNKVQYLLSKSKLRINMGQLAKERIKIEFSIDNMINKFIKLYNG